MNSPNPAYYEAMAAARGVRPTPARSWSILLTSANHGVVGPLGHPFKHAGEHHERVVVVEVPAGAGAPSDEVNLVLRAAPAAEASAGTVLTDEPGHKIERLENELAAVRDLFPIPETGELHNSWSKACSDPFSVANYIKGHLVAAQVGQVAPADLHDAIMRLRETSPYDPVRHSTEHVAYKCGHRDARHAAAELAAGAAAGQVAAPEWRGIKAVLTNLIAVASVRIADKDEEDDQLIADASEAVRQLDARLAAAPSAPAVAQQAPMAVDGARWDLFPGYLIDHCEGDVLSEEGLQSALAGMLKDPQYLAAAAAQASTAGEREKGGDRG